MTTEDLKEKYSMRDILARYSIDVTRTGFAHCPFHKGDREPSLKIYDRDFYCFGCGAHGDIFTFVMQMEHCSFKEAFQRLGGMYQEMDFKTKFLIYRRQQAARERKKKLEELFRRLKLTEMLIDIYRESMRKSEPMSDVWCDSCNAFQFQIYRHEQLCEEVEECRTSMNWTQ